MDKAHGVAGVFGVGSSAEVGEVVLRRFVLLGRGQSERRRGSAEEIHPRAAVSTADPRTSEHLQRRQGCVGACVLA